MSLVHVETEFGTKMSVHQGSCNLDMTCVEGRVPVLRHRPPRSGHAAAAPRRIRRATRDPARSARTGVVGQTVIRMPGIGGTGVVTASRIMQMAAHLDGLHAAGIDQTGLAQKGGPVTSDVRISSLPDPWRRPRQPGGGRPPSRLRPPRGRRRRRALGGVARRAPWPCSTWPRCRRPPCSGTRAPPIPLAAGLRARIARATRADEMVCVDAQSIAERLTGDPPGRQPGPRRRRLPGRAPALRCRELAEAIRLNGVDVPASLAAIDLGTCRRGSPEAVAARPRPRWTDTDRGRRPARAAADLEPDADWPAALRQVVGRAGGRAHRLPERARGPDYLGRVRRRGRHGSGRRRGDPQLPVTGVVRPWALRPDGGQGRVRGGPPPPPRRGAGGLRTRLPGGAPGLHAQAAPAGPPGPAAQDQARPHCPTGVPAPAGRSAAPGTPFDLFGWSAERRDERRFLAEYLAWVGSAPWSTSPRPPPKRSVRWSTWPTTSTGMRTCARASMDAVRSTCGRQLAALTGGTTPAGPLTRSPAGRLAETVHGHGVGARRVERVGDPRSTSDPRGPGRPARPARRGRDAESRPGRSEYPAMMPPPGGELRAMLDSTDPSVPGATKMRTFPAITTTSNGRSSVRAGSARSPSTQDSCGALRRATSSMRGSRSTPTTARPRRSSSMATRPVPHPASSTESGA